MDRVLLLSELRAIVAGTPDLASYTPTSRIHLEWLGKAHALVRRWRSSESFGLEIAADNLAIPLLHETSVAKILNVLHRAIADLDLEVGTTPGGAFGPGAAYDAMRALRDLLSSATSDILVVDPYMDAEVFDAYISAVATGVTVRLLFDKFANSLRPALRAFLSQSSIKVEARQSPELHDRVIFLNRQSCYVLGQSIKDAAKRKTTYLAPLSGEIAAAKQVIYERIWSAGNVI